MDNDFDVSEHSYGHILYAEHSHYILDYDLYK